MSDDRQETYRVVIPLAFSAPAEWQPGVAQRVEEYKARKHDAAYRRAHGLDAVKTSGTTEGNEPGVTPAHRLSAVHSRTGATRCRALPPDVPRVVTASGPAESAIASCAPHPAIVPAALGAWWLLIVHPFATVLGVACGCLVVATLKAFDRIGGRA